MSVKAKRYTTIYKKRVDVDRDVYLPRRAPQGTVYCRGCDAVYYRRRWTLTPPADIRGRAGSRARFAYGLCPACRKVADRFPMGEVRLAAVPPAERGEVLRLLKSEERRAREKNPLERIMKIERGDGEWRVETTTEKLAQRLGRSLSKARGGKVAYRWSHNTRFLRVLWEAPRRV